MRDGAVIGTFTLSATNVATNVTKHTAQRGKGEING